ncbi:30S ribosomal protein S11 [Staphylococcus aureus]
MASETASKSAMEHGLKTVEVTVKGPGPGRESAILAITICRFRSNCAIRDVTPVPHNGCRPPKRRRRVQFMMVLLEVTEQTF